MRNILLSDSRKSLPSAKLPQFQKPWKEEKAILSNAVLLEVASLLPETPDGIIGGTVPSKIMRSKILFLKDISKKRVLAGLIKDSTQTSLLNRKKISNPQDPEMKLGALKIPPHISKHNLKFLMSVPIAAFT
jgi:hypothetical protein